MFHKLTSFLKTTHNRFYTTQQRKYEEVKIPVPWGHVSGKWWHPTDQRPILTLHGWQDNCGSFDRLVPLLTGDVGVLAIDLPGHGLSSKLQQGSNYNNINYPILIRRIQKYFQWDRVSLMGHSLGAISSYTYTMLYPDNVDFLICIDGLSPLYKKDNIKKMPKGIDVYLKYDQLIGDDREPPCYALDEMKEMVAKSLSGSIDIENAHYLLERGVAPSKSTPDKYYFTRDVRLKNGPYFNWPYDELLEGARRMTPPILCVKFTESQYFGNKKLFYEIFDILKTTSKDWQIFYVDGKHHQHLNGPESLHGIIDNFIKKHNVCDRTAGGITPEILS